MQREHDMHSLNMLPALVHGQAFHILFSVLFRKILTNFFLSELFFKAINIIRFIILPKNACIISMILSHLP